MRDQKYPMQAGADVIPQSVAYLVLGSALRFDQI